MPQRSAKEKKDFSERVLTASPMPQIYVFLLLAWPAQEQHFEARDEALRILPLLADTIDTILFHLFIAGREQDDAEELLPAEVLATVGEDILYRHEVER
jgi:hypothetical protein